MFFPPRLLRGALPFLRESPQRPAGLLNRGAPRPRRGRPAWHSPPGGSPLFPPGPPLPAGPLPRLLDRTGLPGIGRAAFSPPARCPSARAVRFILKCRPVGGSSRPSAPSPASGPWGTSAPCRSYEFPPASPRLPAVRQARIVEVPQRAKVQGCPRVCRMRAPPSSPCSLPCSADRASPPLILCFMRRGAFNPVFQLRV